MTTARIFFHRIFFFPEAAADLRSHRAPLPAADAKEMAYVQSSPVLLHADTGPAPCSCSISAGSRQFHIIVWLPTRPSRRCLHLPSAGPNRGVLPASAATPSSDLHEHLGEMLRSQKGTDVTFLVSGEHITAHKQVRARGAINGVHGRALR
ncbi:hypothetical protein PR202_gb28170 [Eleusine coracana subsp. coracana]|uniref:BTB domain-containing protein n=1 Tax=Eleusine coracana subsp. coracana TaxID=191504 RepID=A0AAV5FY68_ELECO|nr:hypothetical protein PR202_gb28170 [Eleusine coracana subsp. coracana]